MTYAVMDSPLGPLTLVATGAGELAGLYMAEHRHRPPIETFGDRDDSVLPAVAAQLTEYFDDGRTSSLWELCTQRTQLAELSPPILVSSIRKAAGR